MNRREFQRALMTAAGASAMAVIPWTKTLAHVVTAPSQEGNQKAYRYRLRYVRRGHTFFIWVRVSEPLHLDRDVRVSLTLSTDRAGLNVMGAKTFVSRSLDSHIARPVLQLSGATWTPGMPLYAVLRLGEENLPTKVWTFSKA